MVLDLNKLKNMILYFAQSPSVRNLGMTKLYKLLYFADVAGLRELGCSISGSEYIKYEHGPVPSRCEKTIESLRRDNYISVTGERIYGMTLHVVRAVAKPDTSVFSKSEMKILQRISISKGQLTAAQLSEESCLEPAWVYADMLCKMPPDMMHYGAVEDPTVSSVA